MSFASVPLYVRDVIGGLGGVLLAACLVPQLVMMWRTKTADDVNLSWVISYMVGLALMLAYLIMEEALIGWLSMMGELLLATVLLILKLWIDRRYAAAERRNAESSETTGVTVRVVTADEAERAENGTAPAAAGSRTVRRAAAVAALKQAPAATGSPDSSAALPTAAAGAPHPSGVPAMLPAALRAHRRPEGHHMTLDCSPAVGATEQEWRALGAWLMGVIEEGVQGAAHMSVRFKHLEIMLPPALTTGAPVATAASTSTAASLSGLAAKPPAVPVPLVAAGSAEVADLDALEPGFSLTVVMGGGHVISEYFVGSGQLTVDVLAVGPRAVQQVQRLGAWLQQGLAQRCGPRMPAASYSHRLLKEE